MLKIAAQRGVRVAWRPLGRRHGEYHSSSLALLNPQLSLTVQSATLAHELGHAHYSHVRTDEPVQHARQERLADEHATELLISDYDYALAERTVGRHPGILARELGVTLGIITAWHGRARRSRRIG
ncbi:ImmA/IrrE family metallo-endopeptidase [Cellulomonas sp. B6]|uniref:ImmA/IrrE family metallo-endopeptidase n=1 Tax=Cellulomonas sp. B6 TaxID=1295626 RepID=UPI000AFAA8F2|nr:ImmA/IrrE family metallo-endopeptidase [Cellulomonas sp. B6]